MDLYGTFWRAEQLSVVVSKFDISPVSDSAILSFSSSFRWNNLEETKIWVPWMHIRYIQWGHPSEENAHAIENFLICGGMWKGGRGRGQNFQFFKCRLGLTTSLRGRTGIIYSSLPEKQSCWFRTLVHYSVKSIYYPNWPKRFFSNMLELDRNYTHSNVWQNNNETRYILYSLCKG